MSFHIKSPYEVCNHVLCENTFCLKCGALYSSKFYSINHEKYKYQPEINPKEILSNMVKNNSTSNISKLVMNVKYMQKRKELIKNLKLVSLKLNFKSQTFYYSIFYLDLIFCKDREIDKLASLYLISLGCLSIAAKFNENDPNVPDMKKFINAFVTITNYRYRFTIEETLKSELFCLKKLEYKLNYYSLYHFFMFFFSHGVIFDNGKVNCNLFNKLMEKVYTISKDIIEYLIEENIIICGDDCYIISVILLRTAISQVFNRGTREEDDVFKTIFQIDENSPLYIRHKKMIVSIFNKIIKRKNSSRNNTGNCQNTTNSMMTSKNAGSYIPNSEIIKNGILQFIIFNFRETECNNVNEKIKKNEIKYKSKSLIKKNKGLLFMNHNENKNDKTKRIKSLCTDHYKVKLNKDKNKNKNINRITITNSSNSSQNEENK